MKYLIDLIKLNVIIIGLALLAACAMQASGAVKADRYKSAIARELTQKLRVDLADQTVQVKLNSVRENGRAGIDGRALAVVTSDKTELPLQFSAKVNLNNQSVEDVSYEFVAAAADTEFAPTLAEDNLMKELMAKISQDYETTNIVISIDGFDTAQVTSLQTKYEGIGEVRIGDFEWRKIKFNVVLDSQSRTATKVLYDVQK
jgi:hypothetical protein